MEPADQVAADNWEEQGDPGFADITGLADPFDFGVFDFHLRPGSPCIDNGGFLTWTVNSGNASTELRVEDAGVFSDGKGVVAGDVIQLESGTATAVIAGINYATNTITLATPLTWQAGAGVSQPYSGTQPDQGVYETESGSP